MPPTAATVDAQSFASLFRASKFAAVSYARPHPGGAALPHVLSSPSAAMKERGEWGLKHSLPSDLRTSVVSLPGPIDAPASRHAPPFQSAQAVVARHERFRALFASHVHPDAFAMQDAAFAVQRRIANASASPADSSVSPAAPAKDLALVSNKTFARLVQKARRVRAANNAANDSNSTRDPVAFDWEAAIGVARESVASSPDVDVCIAARTAIHPPVYYAPPRKSPEPVLHSVSDEDSASATAAASKEAERELAEKLCPSTINARYLNSVHNGHAIGVAGFVAYLPESEVRLPKKIASVARGKKINNVPIYDRARTMLSRELGDNYMRSEGNEIEVQVKSVNWDYGSGTWKIGVTQKFGENDETSSSFYRGLMPSAGSRATRDDPFTSGNILKQLRGRSEPLFGRKAANPVLQKRAADFLSLVNKGVPEEKKE